MSGPLEQPRKGYIFHNRYFRKTPYRLEDGPADEQRLISGCYACHAGAKVDQRAYHVEKPTIGSEFYVEVPSNTVSVIQTVFDVAPGCLRELRIGVQEQEHITPGHLRTVVHLPSTASQCGGQDTWACPHEFGGTVATASVDYDDLVEVQFHEVVESLTDGFLFVQDRDDNGKLHGRSNQNCQNPDLVLQLSMQGSRNSK